jgi:hypothetical protein
MFHIAAGIVLAYVVIRLIQTIDAKAREARAWRAFNAPYVAAERRQAIETARQAQQEAAVRNASVEREAELTRAARRCREMAR